MQIVLGTISAILGYICFKLLTTPASKINRRIPVIRFKAIQIAPTIKIVVKGRVIHIHHWFSFSVILFISIFVSNGFLDSALTRGFLLGGVIQGLRFPDRGIFYKHDKEG